MKSEWNDKIVNLREEDFLPAARWLFRYQYENNPLYRSYTDLIDVDPESVKELHQIPFLPIRFFKSHSVKTGEFQPGRVFESSGTTGMINSQHLVKDLSLYEASFRKGFEMFYGDIKKYCVLGLLPSYLERGQSSLVYMVNDWIQASGHPKSGFYLYDFDSLQKTLLELEAATQPTILIGVTFALLDFAAQSPMPLQHTLIMETGGMKGRKKEMVRGEVHEVLKKAFGLKQIHSEYGMTELLSQAYAKAGGKFQSVPWMKILLREEEDPLHVMPAQQAGRGAVNIIDLANIHSCAFIATDDAARLDADGSFQILGRLDNSDLRGCSLLTA